jgi:hypothetical protein
MSFGAITTKIVAKSSAIAATQYVRHILFMAAVLGLSAWTVEDLRSAYSVLSKSADKMELRMDQIFYFET